MQSASWALSFTRCSRWAPIFLAATAVGMCRAQTPAQNIAGFPYTPSGTATPVHDPSAAMEAGHLFLFSTDESGLLQRGNVPMLCGAAPSGANLTVCGSVYGEIPAWGRQWVPDATNVWAPEVVQLAGQWHVFVAISSFGSQTSVIGHAASASLDPRNSSYGWTDMGPVLTSNASSPFNAIDPSVLVTDSGAVYMSFGSFWGGIFMVQLNSSTGQVADAAVPIHLAQRASGEDAIEGSFLYAYNNQYYLFTSWNYCCRGNASTYEVRVGRSSSPTGPYVDADGVGLTEGGGTYVTGHRGFGWAAGGGQSIVRSSDPSPLMVLHGYRADKFGEPWVQLVWLDFSTGWPVPSATPASQQ